MTVELPARAMRIGEVAARTGTTPRTVRYYEEIGLLPSSDVRVKGKHRLYDERDVERLLEITRLRDLLGLTLEDLKQLIEADDARAGLRRRWRQTEAARERLRIVEESLGHITRQLGLVRSRRSELERLEQELLERRRIALARRRELRED